jgi:hypothetical protein
MHSGGVNKAEQVREQWRERIRQQELSGQSIRAYCRGQGLAEHAFFGWRQRLRKESAPVRFALVETTAAAESVVPIELILTSGDRLRIPHDATTLKLVLGVLRGQA